MSWQPNFSSGLVPQALLTAYELIGRVGENSVSCDCRHHHKFNTTVLSVTLAIRAGFEARIIPAILGITTVGACAHNKHDTLHFETFSASTRQWKLASLMHMPAEMQKCLQNNPFKKTAA